MCNKLQYLVNETHKDDFNVNFLISSLNLSTMSNIIKIFFLKSKNSIKNKTIEIEHTFLKKNVYEIYRTILKCSNCDGKFYNDKIYLQCQDCQINVHKKCAKLIGKNCKMTGDVESDREPDGELDLENQTNMDTDELSTDNYQENKYGR